MWWKYSGISVFIQHCGVVVLCAHYDSEWSDRRAARFDAIGYGELTEESFAGACRELGFEAIIEDVSSEELLETLGRDAAIAAVVGINFAETKRYIVIKKWKEHFTVDEYPRIGASRSRQELLEQLPKGNMSAIFVGARGNIPSIIVGQKPPPQKNEAIVPLSVLHGIAFTPEIVIPKVPRSNSIYSVPIRIKNTGLNTIGIRAVHGSCSCFQGAKYSKKILPQGEETISAEFDLRQYRQNLTFQTVVAIELETEHKSIVSVRIRGTFDDRGDRFVTPAKLDLGTIRANGLVDRSFEVSVFAIVGAARRDRQMATPQVPHGLTIEEIPIPRPRVLGSYRELQRFKVSAAHGPWQQGYNTALVRLAFQGKPSDDLTVQVGFNLLQDP
jgi:hypothetical protein